MTGSMSSSGLPESCRAGVVGRLRARQASAPTAPARTIRASVARVASASMGATLAAWIADYQQGFRVVAASGGNHAA
jgi:hypothetical protein